MSRRIRKNIFNGERVKVIKVEKNEVLMPINEKFIEVFEVFMDTNQRTKIRANNVRQYTEGIVDLILKDKIVATYSGSVVKTKI